MAAVITPDQIRDAFRALSDAKKQDDPAEEARRDREASALFAQYLAQVVAERQGRRVPVQPPVQPVRPVPPRRRPRRRRDNGGDDGATADEQKIRDLEQQLRAQEMKIDQQQELLVKQTQDLLTNELTIQRLLLSDEPEEVTDEEIRKLNQRIDALEKDAQLTQDRLQQELRKYQDLARNVAELAGNANLTPELAITVLRDRRGSLEKYATDLEKANKDLQEQLTDVQAQLQTAQDQVSELTLAQQQQEGIAQSLPTIQQSLQVAQARVAALELERTRLERQTKRLDETIKIRDQTIEDLQQRLIALDRDVADLQDELSNAASDVESLESDLEDAQDALEEAQDLNQDVQEPGAVVNIDGILSSDSPAEKDLVQTAIAESNVDSLIGYMNTRFAAVLSVLDKPDKEQDVADTLAFLADYIREYGEYSRLDLASTSNDVVELYESGLHFLLCKFATGREYAEDSRARQLISRRAVLKKSPFEGPLPTPDPSDLGERANKNQLLLNGRLPMSEGIANEFVEIYKTLGAPQPTFSYAKQGLARSLLDVWYPGVFPQDVDADIDFDRALEYSRVSTDLPGYDASRGYGVDPEQGATAIGLAALAARELEWLYDVYGNKSAADLAKATQLLMFREIEIKPQFRKDVDFDLNENETTTSLYMVTGARPAKVQGEVVTPIKTGAHRRRSYSSSSSSASSSSDEDVPYMSASAAAAESSIGQTFVTAAKSNNTAMLRVYTKTAQLRSLVPAETAAQALEAAQSAGHAEAAEIITGAFESLKRRYRENLGDFFKRIASNKPKTTDFIDTAYVGDLQSYARLIANVEGRVGKLNQHYADAAGENAITVFVPLQVPNAYLTQDEIVHLSIFDKPDRTGFQESHIYRTVLDPDASIQVGRVKARGLADPSTIYIQDGDYKTHYKIVGSRVQKNGTILYVKSYVPDKPVEYAAKQTAVDVGAVKAPTSQSVSGALAADMAKTFAKAKKGIERARTADAAYDAVNAAHAWLVATPQARAQVSDAQYAEHIASLRSALRAKDYHGSDSDAWNHVDLLDGA